MPYEVNLSWKSTEVDPLEIFAYCRKTLGKNWYYGFHSEHKVTIYLSSKSVAEKFPLVAKMRWNIDNVSVGDVRNMPRGLVPYKNI